MRGAPARSALIARLAGTPLGSSQSMILDELRRCILDGEVPPGSPIPVDAVAGAFGVSRIPVREALMTLIGEGLVDHRPNGGYRVAMLTAQEFGEIYLVREALETTALRIAVGQAGPGDDEQAQSALEALHEAVVAGDGRAYHRESRRFHLALIEPCRMSRLLHMHGAAWNLTEPMQPMSLLDSADRRHLHRDHEDMFTAFIARDAETLIGTCGEHHHRLQALIAALPTIYFSEHRAETPRS